MGQKAPIWTRKVNASNITADGQSTAFSVPLADAYNFVLVASNNSGTTPTLDVVVQFSPDEGTTWLDTPIRYTQVTTTDVTEFKWLTRKGEQEAAGGAIVSANGVENGPVLLPRGDYVRLDYDVGGTGPDYDVDLWVGYADFDS